jgi:hypothetical protein
MMHSSLDRISDGTNFGQRLHQIRTVRYSCFLGRLSQTESFSSQHPAFDLHCHPRIRRLMAAFFNIVGNATLLTRDAKGNSCVQWSTGSIERPRAKTINGSFGFRRLENYTFLTL